MGPSVAGGKRAPRGPPGCPNQNMRQLSGAIRFWTVSHAPDQEEDNDQDEEDDEERDDDQGSGGPGGEDDQGTGG